MSAPAGAELKPAWHAALVHIHLGEHMRVNMSVERALRTRGYVEGIGAGALLTPKGEAALDAFPGGY